jgi:hypothetical protein
MKMQRPHTAKHNCLDAVLDCHRSNSLVAKVALIAGAEFFRHRNNPRAVL